MYNIKKKGSEVFMIPKPLVQVNQAFLVITTLLGLLTTPYILLLPFLIGVITLFIKQNPLIRLTQPLLSKDATAYRLEDKAQQLFNQSIATVCLGLSLLGFWLDLNMIGYIFGIMVIGAAGVALMGYCIGCTIRYRYIMWKHKRRQAKSG
ncbi:DUF4395 domain-containing protein [Amphibacillus cookii]|uniref:DUF4395 domain-containing protein n=1 Tax=Amphibacillus cookii TaxID=767787 RepID=UPI001EF89F21|nr:DUF4395 domain-containing protein [Amphibacillus cookii]MBM7540344.1 hypothetical protein [Amphibacillus cookii]